MADIFNIGISALLSTQRVLSTIGHNVANANTPGYSKQRVELAARAPEQLGGAFVGKGVNITDISRLADQFLTEQVRVSTTNYNQISAVHEFASQINNLLADATAGLSPALTDFFNGLQNVATQPASIPIRQAAMGGAQTLIARFHDQQARLEDINRGINKRIEDDVGKINQLADSLASINRDIVMARGETSGGSPNDLLDRRDQMLSQLSELVGLRTVEQDDGAINVTVGNGQQLVIGGNAFRLGVVNDPLDASRKQVSYAIGGVSLNISGNINSGELGGLLNVREDVAEPARNALGQIGAALAQTFNAQHRAGMDLNGTPGGSFFTIPAPSVNAAAANAGTVGVAFDPASVGNLTASDYRLVYSGTNFVLTRLSDNSTQTLSGAGPFNVEGLTITVGAVPAAGDTYLIQPTRNVGRDIALTVTDARQIAAAAPVRSRAALTNGSDAQVSAPQVLDSTNANLLTAATLVFDNPPATYKVNGAGPSIAYTSGANIDINGWRVQITGSPRAGDQFTVEPNYGGVGDNTNVRLLAALQSSRLMDGGTATYQDAYEVMVGDVGSRTQQSDVSRAALKTLLDHAVNSRDQVSGVNLDEEAADLMRYQQAYQAAARVIASANQMFDTLINAIRG